MSTLSISTRPLRRRRWRFAAELDVNPQTSPKGKHCDILSVSIYSNHRVPAMLCLVKPRSTGLELTLRPETWEFQLGEPVISVYSGPGHPTSQLSSSFRPITLTVHYKQLRYCYLPITLPTPTPRCPNVRLALNRNKIRRNTPLGHSVPSQTVKTIPPVSQ